MSYGDYIKALTEADKNGTREEFEAYLAQQMAGSWAAFQAAQAAAEQEV